MDQPEEAYHFMVESRNATQHVLKYNHGTIDHGIVGHGLKDVSNREVQLWKFTLGKECLRQREFVYYFSLGSIMIFWVSGKDMFVALHGWVYCNLIGKLRSGMDPSCRIVLSCADDILMMGQYTMIYSTNMWYMKRIVKFEYSPPVRRKLICWKNHCPRWNLYTSGTSLDLWRTPLLVRGSIDVTSTGASVRLLVTVGASPRLLIKIK